MTGFKSDFMATLSERGFIQQTSDDSGLDALFAKETVSAYIGFDPTATSLHVGSLIQIMMLHWLQKTGHRPVALMGGGTGKIGDPSFKDEARKLLTNDLIAANVASIKQVFARFLTFGDGPTDAIMVNNADWLMGLNYVEFLRDVGRHFSVNRMLAFDSVKTRLDREQSLSFLEFNYMILQAYDFRELSQRHACRLQMGGSDQWGNIVNGIDLARRMDGTEVFGLTSPLITTADGGKMGKTMAGAVWLNADSLSPYDYWQFWRNTQDADVGRFLRLFTDVPLAEIAELEQAEGSAINDVKKRLADEATALCHGPEAAAAAAETARKTFVDGAAGDDLPSYAVAEGSIAIVDALVALGLAASKGEARRLIKGGGARVDGAKVEDEALVIAVAGDPVRISAGKKAHGVLTAA